MARKRHIGPGEPAEAVVTNPDDPQGPTDPPKPLPPLFPVRVRKSLVINHTHFDAGEEYDVTREELVALRSHGAVEE